MSELHPVNPNTDKNISPGKPGSTPQNAPDLYPDQGPAAMQPNTARISDNMELKEDHELHYHVKLIHDDWCP